MSVMLTEVNLLALSDVCKTLSPYLIDQRLQSIGAKEGDTGQG